MSETPISTEQLYKYVSLPFPAITLYNFGIQVFHLLLRLSNLTY